MFRTISFQLTATVFALLLCVNRASAEPQNPDEPKLPVTFLDKAIEMYRAEIQIAHLAMDRAQDERVKDFADAIVRDETQALRRLEDLLPNSVPIVSDDANGQPTEIREKPGDTTRTDIDGRSLTPQHQQEMDRLYNLSDGSFDREFMDVMMNEYRTMITMFEREGSITETTRPRKATDTAKAARDLLPTLRQHLVQAEQLQRQLQTR